MNVCIVRLSESMFLNLCKGLVNFLFLSLFQIGLFSVLW